MSLPICGENRLRDLFIHKRSSIVFFIAFFKIKAHIHMNETILNSQKAKHSERRVGSRWEEHPMTLP